MQPARTSRLRAVVPCPPRDVSAPRSFNAAEMGAAFNGFDLQIRPCATARRPPGLLRPGESCARLKSARAVYSSDLSVLSVACP